MQTTSTFNGIAKKAESREIPLSSIMLGDNVRKTYPKDSLDRLARNIEAVGLLQPLVVVEERDGYRLIAGFRRLRALQHLKWKEVPVRIVSEDTAHKLSKARNIAENTNREDVAPYELARAAQEMVIGTKDNPPEFTREEAALYFGLTTQHLNNLVRCVEKCSPVVLAAWKKDPDNVSMNAITAWCVLPHAEQEKALEDYLGGTKHDKKRLKKSKKAHAGALKKEIVAAREKWDEAKGVYADGVRAALMFVLGERQSIRGPK